MILKNDYEHRMWIAAMAADMAYMSPQGFTHSRACSAEVADNAVEEYRKRCAVEPEPKADIEAGGGM